MSNGPPGWEPHVITTRIDGWVGGPGNIPAAIAEMIARGRPKPTEAVQTIRARMIARQAIAVRNGSMRDD